MRFPKAASVIRGNLKLRHYQLHRRQHIALCARNIRSVAVMVEVGALGDPSHAQHGRLGRDDLRVSRWGRAASSKVARWRGRTRVRLLSSCYPFQRPSSGLPWPSMGGFESFRTARRTVREFEAMLWLRKRFDFVGAWAIHE